MSNRSETLQMPCCCLRTHLGSQQCYFIEKPFVVEELITEIDRVKCLTSPASELKAKAISELVLMMILNASKKIQQINKEILNLGKGLNGNFEVLDVGLILVECLDYFTTSVSLSGISIKRNLDVGKVYILVNRFEIEQKFCNLIANGLEAMKNSKTRNINGIGQQKKRSARRVVQHYRYRLRPAENIDKIFAPYFTTKPVGTGLGLAVVEKVIQAHKGSIAVDSSIGKGTRVTVSLPLKKESLQ